MPDPIVNVACPAITIAVLEDDSGTAVTGATWANAGSLNPAGAAWTVSPVAFIQNSASNIYRLVGYTFTSAGEWLLVATPNGDAAMTVTIPITVTDPTVQAQTVAQAVVGASVADSATGSVGAQLARISTIGDPATVAAAVRDIAVSGSASGTLGAKVNEIGTTTVDGTVPIETNPVTIPILRGNTYSAAIGNAITFTSDGWPDLTGGTIAMQIATISNTSYSLPMSVVTPTGEAEVRLELSSATTAAFPVFVGQYEIVATLTGPATATLATGTFYAKD
jgi:hypothetical protein